MRSIRLAICVSLLITIGLFIVGTSSNATPAERVTFYQDPPSLTPVDLLPLGKSHGDAYYFNATLRSAKEGPIIGELFGVLMVDKLSPLGSAGKETSMEQRLTYLVFAFNNKTDQIVVGGVPDYPAQENQFMPNTPIVRAVLGGTNKYMGVRGQVVSTRNDNGSYTHAFTLLP